MDESAHSADVGARLTSIAQRLSVETDQLLAVLTQLADELPAGTNLPDRTLSGPEVSVLQEAGSLRQDMPALADRASTATAMQYLAMVQQSRPVREVAAALQVSTARVRQRLGDRTLYGIQPEPGSWLVPDFQFIDQQAVRGLGPVLAALPAHAHPVAVQSFLTEPAVDLVLDGEPVSPLTWVASGQSAAKAAELAAAILELP